MLAVADRPVRRRRRDPSAPPCVRSAAVSSSRRRRDAGDRRRNRPSGRCARPTGPPAGRRSPTRRPRVSTTISPSISAASAGSAATAAAIGLNLFDPVETLAGQQLDLAAGERGLDAIAVELDLVHPGGARRRIGFEPGEAGRHEIRQGCGRGLRSDRPRRLRSCAAATPRRRFAHAGGTAGFAADARRARAIAFAAGDRVPHRRRLHLGLDLRFPAGGDLVQGALGGDRFRLLFENVGIGRLARLLRRRL